MKKASIFLMILALLLPSFAGCSSRASADVHVFYYTYSDTYISTVRSSLDTLFKNEGIRYQDYDSNNSQTTQTEQIQTAITKGAKMLVVNIVTTGSDDAANGIVALAKKADIPVVFFNREVSDEVVNSYEKCVFVGTDAAEAGYLQGDMIGDYLLANYEKTDLNGDGKISYVMFMGEKGNNEAIYRTEYSVENANKKLTAAGKPALSFYDPGNTDKYLLDREGKWSAQAANDYMTTILASYSTAANNMVELVICNNDGMAEGVVESLKQAGYNAAGQHVIPVFGVDATDAAKALIAEGSMIGTVKQDNVGMAEAICATVKAIAEGKTPADALASLNDARFTVAPECASKLYVAYAPYLGE